MAQSGRKSIFHLSNAVPIGQTNKLFMRKYIYPELCAHDSAVHRALNGALYLRPNLETNGIARKLHFLLTLNSWKELAHSMFMYGCMTSSSVMLIEPFLCVMTIVHSEWFGQRGTISCKRCVCVLWCKFWVPNSTEKISSEASFQAGRSFRKTELSKNVLIGQGDSSKLLFPICQNPFFPWKSPSFSYIHLPIWMRL